MGMFDTIHCQYPLPDPEVQAGEFQTKDLESLMDHYTLTEAGRLIKHAEHRLFEKDQDSFFGFVLALKESWDEDTHYHGELRFYDSIGEVFYEYVARFNAGQLETIQRLPERRPWTLLDRAPALARSRRYQNVFRQAVAVYGSVEAARSWLWQPSVALGDKTPLELVESFEGYDSVRALLTDAEAAKV